MFVRLEIPEQYRGILEDIAKTMRAKSVRGMLETEIMHIAKENLEDYGFNENGIKKSELEQIEGFRY